MKAIFVLSIALSFFLSAATAQTARKNNERLTNTLNIQENPTAPSNIYPNPTRGSAKVTVNADPGTRTISLIDNSGKIIRSVTGVSFIVFDIKGLSRGKYFIQFEKENGDQVRKPLLIN